jgi:hypothetical protein
MGGALMLGIGALGGGTAIPTAAQVDEASPWMMDLELAKVKARESGKPIFLVFR